MAADITETRPELYHALLADGWGYQPLQGGGGVFRRIVGVQRVAVQVRRGTACVLTVDSTGVGQFTSAAPDSVVAAAALAQRKELGE